MSYSQLLRKDARKLGLAALLIGSLFVPVTVGGVSFALIAWGLAIVLELESIRAAQERQRQEAQRIAAR